MNTPNDGQLLQSFRTAHDQDAFTELLRRHGAAVLGAARALVAQPAAAEDVAQAAFLALARKAGGLDNAVSVGGWLHHVTLCLARDERRRESRRQAREQEAAMLATQVDTPHAPPAAALAALHEELGRLPEKFRQPVILHHLEGLSYEAAAAALGCNQATFGTRLARGREKLRKRLVGRGVTLGADGIGVLDESATAAVMPAALVAATCQAASLLAAGKTLSGTGLVSAKVAYLTKSALKTLFWAKVKTAAAAAVVVTAVVGGGFAATLAVVQRPAAPKRAVAVPAVVTPAPAQGGQVWAWGDNRFGQLGDGTTVSRGTPLPVQLADGRPFGGITAIAAGETHTVALDGAGRVWAWGDNRFGQLGDGTTANRSRPVPVRLADGTPLAGVIAVAAGRVHTVAVKADGTLWTWGGNDGGQLGTGTTTGSLTPHQLELPGGPARGGVRAVATGGEHNVALAADGTLWAWGADVCGELGDGTTGNFRLRPVRVRMADGTPLSGVIAIAAGFGYTVALKADHTVWKWGAFIEGPGAGGELRHAQPDLTPVPVTMRDGTVLANVTAVASGDHHVLAVRHDRTLWAWGCNQRGEIGDSVPPASQVTPVVQVMLPDGKPLAAVSASGGGVHTAVVAADRTLWAWGWNGAGQLGDSTSGRDRLRPGPVLRSDGTPLANVTAVAAGGQHTVAVVNGQSSVDPKGGRPPWPSGKP